MRAGGFGQPPAAGGFGQPPAAGGFGQPPAAGGFGQPPAAGGFGQPPAAGGFPQPGGVAGGLQPPGAAQMQQQQAVDAASQFGPGRYMIEVDQAFNALHPNCRFRTFVYSICTPGQSEQAEKRVRYGMRELGGGAREEQWLVARRENPGPEKMFPVPLHFFPGLLARAKKQKTATESFEQQADIVKGGIQQLRRLSEENAAAFQRLAERKSLIEYNIVQMMAMIEAMRQSNLAAGEERHTVSVQVARLQQQLDRPGAYFSSIQELKPCLNKETAAAANESLRSSTAAGGPSGRRINSGLGSSSTSSSSLRRHVDMMKEWNSSIARTAVAIERLAKMVGKDSADVHAAWTQKGGGGGSSGVGHLDHSRSFYASS